MDHPKQIGALPFIKMHGLGNDYVYVDMFTEKRLPAPADELAKLVSDRHFGIGGDGMILIGPSQVADLRMTMFNADGSEGAMCGNGIRCVAKYGYEAGHARCNPLTVQTASGVKTIQLVVEDGRVRAARVNMGQPGLAPADIPAKFAGERIVDQPLSAAGEMFRVTCVSMGNPHAVIFCDDTRAVDLDRFGPAVERHEVFPDRANVHFVQVHRPGEITMRTWERGSGVTLACGTGACAACVAGVLVGRSGRRVTAHLPGGDLELDWDEPSGDVFMTGPAVEVCRGVWQPR